MYANNSISFELIYRVFTFSTADYSFGLLVLIRMKKKIMKKNNFILSEFKSIGFFPIKNMQTPPPSLLVRFFSSVS